MIPETLFDRLYSPDLAARVAVLYEHKEFAYHELRAGTVRAAEGLHAIGIGARDRVAILLNDSPEFITSFVAIISLGAIAVPINLALRREDQLFILKDCRAGAAIVEAKAAGSLFQASDSQTDVKNLFIVSRGDGSFESFASSLTEMNAQDFAGA